MEAKEKREETTKVENRIKKINFYSLFTGFLGIAIGGLATFYWNDISEFYSSKIGFTILGIAILFALVLLLKLFSHFLKKGQANTSENIINHLFNGIRQKRLTPELVNNLLKELKPYFSFWTLVKLIGLVITTIVAVLGGIIAIQQNKLLNNQNAIIENQNNLLVTQNSYIAQELNKIEQQTILLESQSLNTTTQTELFIEQNRLATNQLKQSRKEIELSATQNLLLEEQNKLTETQNDRLDLQNNLLEADRRSSLVFILDNLLN